MISKLDYLMELKKLKSLNELVIEDNPVLVLKESSDILRSLPIKIKQKDQKEQKGNTPTPPTPTAGTTSASSAGGNSVSKTHHLTVGQTNNSKFLLYSFFFFVHLYLFIY
jgi:hypothetical protein